MRIGIDIRCLVEGRRTGVEEYTLNLLANLFELDQRNEYILFFNSFKKSDADFFWLAKYENVKLKKFRFPNKLLNFLFWYLDWPKIDKMIGGADILFLPNIIFASASRQTKLISTIHDLSFECYPETFSWKRRFWHIFVNTKKICRRSERVIAVSGSTKNDLVSMYKIAPKKIVVIHSGIAETFKPIDRNEQGLIRVKEKYDLPYKFILHFGTIEPRKNIIGIIKAYNILQQEAQKENNEEILKHKLVIAGSSGWKAKKIFDAIENSPFNDKIKLINFVPDQDKRYFFNLASLFVYPSFFEGFGFPPLEAMACGVPTIVSNNSSLPEVVGDGAILIDPDKPDEIYSAMKQMFSSKELRSSLVARGLEQAQKFQWKKSAEEFLKIINKI